MNRVVFVPAEDDGACKAPQNKRDRFQQFINYGYVAENVIFKINRTQSKSKTIKNSFLFD